MNPSEMVRFRINAYPMYESNKNSIVDMHHNSYIAFGHAGSCNMWITAPVTNSTGNGICQSQKIQVVQRPRRVLTYFRFRFLRGPLVPSTGWRTEFVDGFLQTQKPSNICFKGRMIGQVGA